MLKQCAETHCFSVIIICFIWIIINISTHTFMSIFFIKNHKILVYPSSFQKKNSKFLNLLIKFRRVVFQIITLLYSHLQLPSWQNSVYIFFSVFVFINILNFNKYLNFFVLRLYNFKNNKKNIFLSKIWLSCFYYTSIYIPEDK